MRASAGTVLSMAVLTSAGLAVGYALASGKGESTSETSRRVPAEPTSLASPAATPGTVTAEAALAKLETTASRARLQALLAGMDHLALVDFLTRLDAIKTLNPWQEVIRDEAFRRLIETDPSAALDHALGRSEIWFQKDDLDLVFAEIAQKNPRDAIALLTELDHAEEQLRETATRGLVKAWASRDSAAVLAWLRRERGEEAHDKYWAFIMGIWAETDPGAAMAAMEANPERKADDTRKRTLERWFEADHDAALAWVFRQEEPAFWESFWRYAGSFSRLGLRGFELLAAHPPKEGSHADYCYQDFASWSVKADQEGTLKFYAEADEALQRKMLPGLVTALAATDPAQAVALLDDGPKGWFRHNEVREVAMHFLRLDPVAAAAWWEKLPADERGFFSLDGVQDTDGLQSAVKFAASLSDPTRHLNYFAELSDTWSAIDPTGALAWAESLPEGALRSTASAKAFAALAAVDPAAALARAVSVEDVALRGRFLTDTATVWAQVEPAKALDAVLGIPGAAGLRAFDAALASASRSAPAEVAALLARRPELLASADRPSEAIGLIAGNWAQQDYPEALAWAGSLPEGAGREHGLAAVAGALSYQNPAAGRALLDTLPTGAARDAALERGARDLRSSDAPTAFDWALAISDPQIQAARAEDVVGQWQSLDPAAARQALNDPRLSPELRAQLEAKLTPR